MPINRRGPAPVLTEQQREDLKAVVLKRRELKRQAADLLQQRREIRARMRKVKAELGTLPTNIEMAARHGVDVRYLTKLAAGYVHKNRHPLDVRREQQAAA